MKVIHLIVSLFVVTLFVINLSFVSGISGFMSFFTGTVKIDSRYANEKLLIEAYIDNVKKGETYTYFSGGMTWYVIDVANGTNGNKIRFKVDGNWATQEGTYNDSLDYTNLDLTITTGASTTTTTSTDSSSDGDDETTTTTIREISVIMPGATTTTTIQTTPSADLGTTTTVVGATTTTVSQDVNFQPATTTTAEKTNGSKRIVISQKNKSTKSPEIIGSMVNFVTGNSLTFLLVIGAFLTGYYVQKIRS